MSAVVFISLVRRQFSQSACGLPKISSSGGDASSCDIVVRNAAKRKSNERHHERSGKDELDVRCLGEFGGLGDDICVRMMRERNY